MAKQSPDKSGPGGGAGTATQGTGGSDFGGAGQAGGAGRNGGDARQEARGAVHSITEDARRQLSSAALRQKDTAAEQIGSVGKALHKSADELKGQGQASVANLLDQAALGLDSLSSTLRDNDISGLIGQVEDIARRQPALFLGGAVAAGFVLARFLKSSDDDRYAESLERQSAGGQSW